MKTNMGSADRIIRIVVGLLLAVLYFAGILEGTLGIVLLVLGIVFIGTASIKVCPLYMPFGINTGAKTKE